MNWKEIFKVSSILGIIYFVLLVLTDIFVRDDWAVEIAIICLIGTGLILNRKLNKKDDWGIIIGMIISLFVFMILSYLIIDLFGL